MTGSFEIIHRRHRDRRARWAGAAKRLQPAAPAASTASAASARRSGRKDEDRRPDEGPDEFIARRAAELGARVEMVKGRRGSPALVAIRRLVMGEVRARWPELSIAEIGRLFGGNAGVYQALRQPATARPAPRPMQDAHVYQWRQYLARRTSRSVAEAAE